MIPTALTGPPQLRLSVAQERGRTRIVLDGELDIASAPELARVLRPICAQPGARVEIDLTSLTFLDCCGALPIRQAAADLLAGRGVLVVLAADRLQRLVLAEVCSDLVDPPRSAGRR